MNGLEGELCSLLDRKPVEVLQGGGGVREGIICVHLLPVRDLLDADGTKPELYSGQSAPCRIL